jgi:hypothetical protein
VARRNRLRRVEAFLLEVGRSAFIDLTRREVGSPLRVYGHGTGSRAYWFNLHRNLCPHHRRLRRHAGSSVRLISLQALPDCRSHHPGSQETAGPTARNPLPGLAV